MDIRRETEHLPLFAVRNPPRSTARQSTRFDTQDEAFAAISGSQRGVVLAAIRESPRTCDELEVALEMTHQSCSAAINWLMNRGLVVADGYRNTRSNRRARVWTIPPLSPQTPLAPP